MDLVSSPNATAIAAIVAAVGARVVEGSLTENQALMILLAGLGGKADGGGSATIHFRNQADTKNRITFTVDANGNRTAVTLDLT
jgi:hypothetical protein